MDHVSFLDGDTTFCAAWSGSRQTIRPLDLHVKFCVLQPGLSKVSCNAIQGLKEAATSYLHVVLEPPLLIIYNHLHEFLGVFEKVINVTFWAGNLAARCFRVAHDGGRTSCLHDTLHSCKFHLFKNQRLPDNLLLEDCLSRFG